MGIKYEVIAAGEKYQDRDGNEKTRWVKMGVVLERQDGSLTLKLESIPVGFNGWANLWEPKPAEKPAKSEKKGVGFDGFKEDIPF